jgi:putative transposase
VLTENGYIESFNGKLRDQCLYVEVFFNLADARRKLHLWRGDYNHDCPHSTLDERTPASFAAAAELRVPELDPDTKRNTSHPIA